MNETQAAAKNLDFSMEVRGKSEVWYLGDQLRLNQILMNLLSNAIKFTGEGGSVHLRLDVTSMEAGMVNHRWYEDYRAGRTGMKGHMEPAFEIMQRFIDQGILRADDYNVRPSMRSDMMYVKQGCAMILETQDAVKYCEEYGRADSPEIGMLPFFSGNGPDSDYLLSIPNYYIAANSKLK